MDELIKEYSTVLAEEENLLDRLAEKQKMLRVAITNKDWESLTGHINEVNLISESFQKFDVRRDEIQEQLKKLQNAKPGDFSKLMGDKVKLAAVADRDTIAIEHNAIIIMFDTKKIEMMVKLGEDVVQHHRPLVG